MYSRLWQCVRFFTTRSTFEPKQLEQFNKLSKVWWDIEGIMKPLHAMNGVRIPRIQNRLTHIGAINPGVNQKAPLSGLSILDVGCGGGIMSEPLSQLGANVTGLDCNIEMLNIARAHSLNQNNNNLRYFHNTIEEHAIDNKEKYDVVVASETIEHVREQDLFLKCCSECLKPGGSIFMTTNSKSRFSEFFFITLVENILRIVPKGTHDYEMFIDVEDLKKRLHNENCVTVFTSGMVYNPLKNKWKLIKNHYILNYVLHAVKTK